MKQILPNTSWVTRIVMSLFLAVGMFTAVAQTKTVTGTVLDTNGESIIGANVVVSPSVGTITDIDGNFSLNDVPVNGTLTISYIGYATQTVSVAGRTNIKVTLEEEGENLDEVVVVGYGVMKKRDLTGSVASIKSNDLKQVATSNAMQAMQAKVPGLDLQQSSGQAGAGINMTLRGNRSITASNSPLILVDGVEYGSTLDIPASDIESMDILKDASSTAIYGTKGANGVIIITTKRGKAGKTRVDVNSYVSFNSPTNMVKSMFGDKEVQRLVDAKNYATDYASGNWGSANSSAEEVLTRVLDDGTLTYDIYKDKSYTDWSDLILKNGVSQNYELSVSGGNDKTNYSISVAAMFDQGLMKNDQMDRYNGRINIDHSINKYVKVGASAAFTYKDNDARNSGVYSQALKMTSITHAYLNDGTINQKPNPWYQAHSSPMLDEVDGAYQKNIRTTRFLGNGYLQITPINGLVLKTMFAVDQKNVRTGEYKDYEGQGQLQASPAVSHIDNEQALTTSIDWQNTLNYTHNFAKRHDLTLLLGHEMTQTVNESIDIYGNTAAEHYYTSSFYDVTKIAATQTSSEYVKTALHSVFGRVNYNLDQKYLLTASVRADGSSVLAEGHKWGAFPSVALGWRIIDEDWMQRFNGWMNNMKFRASWGLSGNAAVDAYQTIAKLSAIYPGLTEMVPANLANKDLTWEKTSAFDLGLDFGFFNNRVSGSVDYYWTRTYDLLYYRSAPATSVYTSGLANVGETKGRGIEVALNTLAVKAGKFSWDINWTYTHSTDELTKLADGLTSNISGTDALIVGQPVSIYYDYETNGTWGVGEYAQYVADMAQKGITVTSPLASYGDPGTLKIVDQNGDGTIDADHDKIVYNRSPKHIFGMNNTFSYGDFSLGVLLYARLGGYMYYKKNAQVTYDDSNWADVDYWTPTNTGAKFPSPGLGKNQQGAVTTYLSTLYWEKADYFKIKDITLSYSLPHNLATKAMIANARIYCSLKNMLTFSKVDNYDPERGGDISFPMQKQVVIGVNLQF